MNKQALIEGTKELGRVVLVALIPIILASVNTQTGEITLNMQIVTATALVALLKAVDKYVHKEPGTKSNGILPF